MIQDNRLIISEMSINTNLHKEQKCYIEMIENINDIFQFIHFRMPQSYQPPQTSIDGHSHY